MTPRDPAPPPSYFGRSLGRGSPRGLSAGCLSLGSVLLLAVALMCPRPARAAPPRIVIIDLLPRALPAPHDKTDLAVELSHTIEAAGCTVVRICRAADCRVAQTDEEDVHLLSFEGRYEQSRFSCAVSIEVRRPPPSVIEYRDQGTNPVCPAARLIIDTRSAGKRVCDELRTARAPSANPAWTLPAVGATAVTPPLPTVQTKAPAPHPPASPARLWLGPALVAVGAGVAILGGYQAAQHGDLTHCQTSNLGEQVCTHTKQRPLAIPLLLLGATGIGWGVWEISAQRDLDLLDGISMVSFGAKF